MTVKEKIQPVVAKSNAVLTVLGEETTPTELFSLKIGNPNEKGWRFGCGDPEFWKFSGRLIVPNGRVLDLGLGHGRTSVYFALNEMHVTGYETDPNALKVMRTLQASYDLPIDIREKDIRTADFGLAQYDTVMIGQTFAHFADKKDAIAVFHKAIDALRPRGHLWIRTGTKADSSYEELDWLRYSCPEVTKVNDDVFMAPCICSGEYKIEPQLFFETGEIPQLLSERGLTIVHMQSMPEKGRENIMYGEDWRDEYSWDKVGGMVTVLARK